MKFDSNWSSLDQNKPNFKLSKEWNCHYIKIDFLVKHFQINLTSHIYIDVSAQMPIKRRSSPHRLLDCINSRWNYQLSVTSEIQTPLLLCVKSWFVKTMHFGDWVKNAKDVDKLPIEENEEKTKQKVMELFFRKEQFLQNQFTSLTNHRNKVWEK